LNTAAALETRLDTNEGLGGTPVPCEVSMIQRASSKPGVQAGAAGALLTVKVSLAKFPVSSELMKR
jgi:hypothetical protein